MSPSSRIGMGARTGWWAVVAGMTVIGVLEAVVLHFLATALLPAVVARIVDAVVGGATALLLIAVASPLWSAIRVDAARVRARFGWLAAVDIPRREIDAVECFRPPPQRPAELGLDFDPESGLLSFLRSPGSPLVRIDFRDELPARTHGIRTVRARAVLLSTADAERLLAALR
ncbi:hypothetical protein ACFVUS_03635 [Nocardia sp. NPDC058058]|uniref:hypothetical protein n=1 Tax=Nocardia sp. NPDC058058 TaxID=3346317 RepID=UPI0036DE2208